MKTIQITDEQYEFLKEAQTLLKTQDGRCTRDPLYCIMEKKRTYGYSSDYASDFVWIWDGEEIADNSNNIFEKIVEYSDEETIRTLYRDNVNCYNTKESVDEIIESLNEAVEDTYEIQDWLSEKCIYKVYYKEASELSQSSNIFSIFEKDAKEYTESKNSTKIFDYAESTWRATRMVKLIELLKELNLKELL